MDKTHVHGPESLVWMENISKKFGTITALQDVDFGVEAEAGPDRLLDADLVDHRQHAGHGRVDQRHLRIRLGPERGRRAGKELGVGDDLGMDFQPDNRFVFHKSPYDKHFSISRLGGK